MVRHRQPASIADPQPTNHPFMDKRDVTKFALTTALLLLAILALARSIFGNRAPGEQAFFYDPSAERLFTAPASAVPPIRGVDGDEEDAVRAVVVSTTGNPRDRGSWQIAYLERYSPELKRQMEEAQATGGSPRIGRGAAQAHRFVRRVEDAQWYPMYSPEAESIISGWLSAGPNGGPATICTP